MLYFNQVVLGSNFGITTLLNYFCEIRPNIPKKVRAMRNNE